MKLEELPNELLLDLFEFLDAAELFHAFRHLNNRFNTLLFIHFRTYHVNFHSVFKYQSDFLSRRYFPLISNQIISFHLSDNEGERPPETDLFFSFELSLKQFIHLRSLSLCYIDCDATLSKLMIDCQDLHHLTHLKVIKCHPEYTSSVNFSNTIWSLSRLIHCRLDMDRQFYVPTIVSSSLEYLSISCQSFRLRQMIDLLQYTTQLRCLHISLSNSDNEHHRKLPSVLSVTMLKLSYAHSLYGMVTILQAMSNLTQLAVDAYNIDYNGCKWEKLIENYLPKLKVFHLSMYIELPSENHNEKLVDELLDTFRTQFWLEKHQWYMRCHHRYEDYCIAVLLYSLPYTSVKFSLDLLTMMPYKSTCSSVNDYFSYDRVKNLSYHSSFNICGLSLTQFSNIRNLSITLSFDKKLWKNIPIFYQLTSITVLLTNEDARFHLQSLLDRSPRLYSLKIHSWPASQVPLVNNTNTSLRRLDLRLNNFSRTYSVFSSDACAIFIQSPLGMQCEELLIRVDSHTSALDLVHGMRNLRILRLIVDSRSDKLFSYRNDSEESQRLLRCLRNNLPPTCTISECSYNNSFWIYLKKS